MASIAAKMASRARVLGSSGSPLPPYKRCDQLRAGLSQDRLADEAVGAPVAEVVFGQPASARRSSNSSSSRPTAGLVTTARSALHSIVAAAVLSSAAERSPPTVRITPPCVPGITDTLGLDTADLATAIHRVPTLGAATLGLGGRLIRSLAAIGHHPRRQRIGVALIASAIAAEGEPGFATLHLEDDRHLVVVGPRDLAFEMGDGLVLDDRGRGARGRGGRLYADRPEARSWRWSGRWIAITSPEGPAGIGNR